MPRETLPADIASLIDQLHHQAFLQGALHPSTHQGSKAERDAFDARAALEAIILLHLNGRRGQVVAEPPLPCEANVTMQW